MNQDKIFLKLAPQKNIKTEVINFNFKKINNN